MENYLFVLEIYFNLGDIGYCFICEISMWLVIKVIKKKKNLVFKNAV